MAGAATSRRRQTRTIEEADLTPHTFLAGLGTPERCHAHLSHALDVVAVEADDFRSPEPPGEAGQEQRPVPRRLIFDWGGLAFLRRPVRVPGDHF